MQPPRILLKTLRDMRWQVLLYGVGLALLAALVVALYPSYSAQLQDFELPEGLQNLFGTEDYATPEGFLSAEFFSQTITVVLAIFAVMQGTAALAGEEANGTLDLLLAQPVTRRRLAIEKIAAFLIGSALVSLLICPAWLISVPAVGVEISTTDLLVASFAFLPLVWAMYAISLMGAAVLPRRRTATAVVVAYFAAAYLLYALGQTVEVLSPVRWLTPFAYYNGGSVLTEGVDVAGALVLLFISAACCAVAILAFDARDIGVERGLSLSALRRRGHVIGGQPGQRAA